MKKILFSILSFLLIIQIANCAMIEVKIPQDLKGNISSYSFNYSLDLSKFQVEFYNTGSIAYKSRIRMNIFNDSQWLFTGWSEEKTLMPGDRKYFEIYWYTNSTGNFTVNLRPYFANEILEKQFTFEKNTSYLPEDIFDIENFRTYNDYVIFDVKSKKDATNVIIMPHDFPLGWVFEQKKIDIINKGVEKTVVIKYQSAVWTLGKIAILVASDEGKYYTEKTFELKKETGVEWFVHYIIDTIKITFSAN